MNREIDHHQALFAKVAEQINLSKERIERSRLILQQAKQIEDRFKQDNDLFIGALIGNRNKRPPR